MLFYTSLYISRRCDERGFCNKMYKVSLAGDKITNVTYTIKTGLAYLCLIGQELLLAILINVRITASLVPRRKASLQKY